MSYSSVAGIARKGNLILVALRLPPGEMSYTWEFPGGKVEAGEQDADALIREFDEEFGITITVAAFIGKSTFIHHEKQYELHAYEVQLQSENFQLRFHSHIKWLTLDEIEKLQLADSDRALIPAIRSYLYNINAANC
ncbi:MAG TPA: NUDIX domain-containing protein [Spirochaetia bacterium]|nr:NUDIX domain-containing protein [Spirochaetales bacterium]HRS64297.1 NUDIX domain-containing protein [Spirochaetia bacterium]HOT58324.1 NUDIX domain-containing protein [Spirochaetales bacterium]HPD80070.1 NUDIX domain-containing protein [Spirochaetales bacterium]HQG39506.1 NUDIX domain-containing protein [Spirochaetales bacterium]